MNKIWLWLTTDDKGASLIEYALLVILIAIVALSAVAFMGEETSTLYSEINSGLDQ
ncbi:MAG: Flp family type IVb pilin [Actinobacteria bacterium]|nr:MAG: Flp family type IVb pilin [Actinomycetota bacterium]REK37382.1 MAG: Flp family type IVb pilin [Actinomycetota bacterium]